MRVLLVLCVLVLLAILAAVTWYATNRDEARPLRQSLVIATALAEDVPGAWLGEWLADDTTAARVVEVGSSPATLVTPRGDEAHPAIVMLVPERASELELARVRDVQHAIASAGLSAWAVRVARDQDLLAHADARDRVIAALDDVAHHETTRDGRMSIIATGLAASLALTAAVPDNEHREPRAVLAVQPVADVPDLVATAVADPTETTLRTQVGHALVRVARATGDVPDGIPSRLLDAADTSPDPLAALAAMPRGIAPPKVRQLFDVLRAGDREQVLQAWRRLPPDVRAAADAVSPILVADRIDVRVLVVTPTDPAFAQQGRRLVDAIPEADLRLVDATDPSTLVDEASEVRDAIELSAWWLRIAGA